MKFFAMLARFVLAAMFLCVGPASAQTTEQGLVQAPTFVVGDTWVFLSGSSTLIETVKRVEGQQAFIERVTVDQWGKRTELSLIFANGVRQDSVAFRQTLKFPLVVGEKWEGRTDPPFSPGKFTNRVVKKEMLQIAGGTYEGYWHQFILMEDAGAVVTLNYVYVPYLKRVAAQERNQYAVQIRLLKFSITDGDGKAVTWTDPKFADKLASL